MRRRTGAIGTLIALAAMVPWAETAHAQDPDRGDFAFQVGAQAFFDTDRSDPHRLDEDAGPDDGIACEALPRRGDALTPAESRPSPEPPTGAPATTPATTTMAPATSAPTATAPTAAPATPAPTSTPPPPPVSATATLGVRGGVGGTTTTGPSNWDTGIGAAFMTGGVAMAAAYVAGRRRF